MNIHLDFTMAKQVLIEQRWIFNKTYQYVWVEVILFCLFWGWGLMDINLRRLFTLKAILVLTQKFYYLSQARVLFNFPEGISPKLKVTARLEFDLA